MSFKFKDNSSVVLHQLRANMDALGDDLKENFVEMVQDKMLYGYKDPHGADGHTEIVDTGRLFDSIGSDVKKESQNTVTVTVGTDVPYAEYVHEGTYKLKGRPFIRDALFDNQEEIEKQIVSGLKNGFE